MHKVLNCLIYCQATGTGTGPGPGPEIGDWGLGWGIWNGKMGMGNREYPQSQEMGIESSPSPRR